MKITITKGEGDQYSVLDESGAECGKVVSVSTEHKGTLESFRAVLEVDTAHVPALKPTTNDDESTQPKPLRGRPGAVKTEE